MCAKGNITVLEYETKIRHCKNFSFSILVFVLCFQNVLKWVSSEVFHSKQVHFVYFKMNNLLKLFIIVKNLNFSFLILIKCLE